MLVLPFYVKHLQGLPRLAQCSQGIEHDKDSRFSYQAWGLVIYIVLPNIKGISSMKQLRELGIIETVTLHVLQKIHKVFSDIEALLSGTMSIGKFTSQARSGTRKNPRSSR